MATTASGVTIPGSSPTTTAATPIQDHWNNLGTSLNGRLIVPVASGTARAALVTALAAEGYTISASNPLYVHRADADAGLELEYTINGTTWSNRDSLFSVVGASVYGSNYTTAKAVRRAILRSVGTTTSGGLTDAIPMPSGLTALLDVHATLVYTGSPSAAILLMRRDASSLPTSMTYQLRNSTTDVGISLAAYDIRLEVTYQV